MATRKKRPASRSSRSSSGKSMTFSSVLLGLIIGLSVAAIAAFMIMRSPSPIQDHRQPATGQGQPDALSALSLNRNGNSSGKPLIDPNAWMNSDGSINSAQQPPNRQKIEPLPPLIGIPDNARDMPFTAGGVLPPAKTPANPPSKADDDQIASLINTLPAEKPAPGTGKQADKPSLAQSNGSTPAGRNKPASSAAIAANGAVANDSANTKSPASSAGSSNAASSQAGSTGPRYLQVGAFRDEKEADASRARMIMMGFNVQIQKARVNNMDVNRVRIGPFNTEQEIKASRAQLSGANISSTIVR